MKKLAAILFIFTLTIYSCSDDPTQLKEKNLIPRSKFVDMLTEMHMIDAMTSNSGLASYFPSGDSIDIYDYIFKKYEVTPAEFDSTIVQYSRRPDLFIKIYNDVTQKLTYMQDTVNKTLPKFSRD